ncbi:MAG: glycosyl hydrolase 53 family protein [Planctomycetaceae bacterium]
MAKNDHTRSLVQAALALVLACATTCHAGDATTEFRVAISISPFAEVIAHQGIVLDDGNMTASTAEEIQRLFVAHGANEVYARIGTKRAYQPGNGDHSVNRGLERARLAKSLGLSLNPELGLFKSYGDITHQPPPDFSEYAQIKVPGDWMTLTLEQMLPVLRQYGASIAREILDTGVQVRIWDLGNEVEYGTAGVAIPPMPRAGDGSEGKNWYKAPNAIDPEIGKMDWPRLQMLPEPQRIAWLQTHLWPHIAKLLGATADGIRSVDPQARFSTHVSGVSAVRPATGVAFYKTLKAAGFFPDELGFSYYPTSDKVPPDRWQAFKNTATAVHRELGRPVFIAEFGYPAGQMTGVYEWNSPVEHYPQTIEGQAAFLRDLTTWGAKTRVLSGIRPWAPDLPIGWGPMSFFSLTAKKGTARPVLDSIAEGLRRASQ